MIVILVKKMSMIVFGAKIRMSDRNSGDADEIDGFWVKYWYG